MERTLLRSLQRAPLPLARQLSALLPTCLPPTSHCSWICGIVRALLASAAEEEEGGEEEEEEEEDDDEVDARTALVVAVAVAVAVAVTLVFVVVFASVAVVEVKLRAGKAVEGGLGRLWVSVWEFCWEGDEVEVPVELAAAAAALAAATVAAAACE